MGKWFEGYSDNAQRLAAIDHARARGLSAWELLYKNPIHRVYYAGVVLPQKVQKDLGKGRVHILRIWYPGEGRAK